MIGIVDMSHAYSAKLLLEQGAHRAIEKMHAAPTGEQHLSNTLKTEAVCQVNGRTRTASATRTDHRRDVLDLWLECNGARPRPIYRLDPSRVRQTTAAEVATSRMSRTTYTPMFPLHLWPSFERRWNLSPVGYGRNEDSMTLTIFIRRYQQGVAAIELAFALPILVC